MRVPLSVSVILGLAVAGLGCGLTAFAQQTGAPDAVFPPLPIVPPRIIAEAGVLPTSPFAALDHFDEWMELNVFSFGLGSLRARIALTQAAERIAELQALEQETILTPALNRAILNAHGRRIALASRIVAQRVSAGRASADLVLLLLRTRLSAADVLEELEEELVVQAELDEVLTEDVGGGSEEPADILDEIEDAVEDLVHVEEDLFTGGPAAQGLPPEILRVLAEQKIAKAERDFQRALFTIEERLAHGKVLIADAELRAAASAALITARQLFDAGNYAEALAVASEARKVVHRLKSGKIAVAQERLRRPDGEEQVGAVIADLVDEGLIGIEDQQAALARARDAITELRLRRPEPVPDGDTDDDADEREGAEQRSGSSGGPPAAGGDLSDGGSSGSGQDASGPEPSDGEEENASRTSGSSR